MSWERRYGKWRLQAWNFYKQQRKHIAARGLGWSKQGGEKDEEVKEWNESSGLRLRPSFLLKIRFVAELLWMHSLAVQSHLHTPSWCPCNLVSTRATLTPSCFFGQVLVHESKTTCRFFAFSQFHMNTFYVYFGIIYCILESVLTLQKSICCKMWECCWRAKLVLLQTFLSLFLFEQNLDENKIRFLFPQWGTCSDTAAKVRSQTVKWPEAVQRNKYVIWSHQRKKRIN